jgi:hypothetical protein
MKRFAVAALVAVAVTFAAQREASANCGWYWKGNIGLNFSWDAVMGTFSNPCCPSGGGGYPPLYYGYYGPTPGYGYAPQSYAQGYATPYYAAPAQAPAPAQQPATPAVQQQPTTAQVGYYYYPYSYSTYYYGYQAPSYWYGR